MENTEKVFHSEVIRDENQLKNNLLELINIVPAVPLELKDDTRHHTCNFVPKLDKTYVPKRTPRLKVKTIRDIRNLFESDIYAYLTKDLEKQQSYLLKQFINGYSNEKTIIIAKKLLKSDLPLSRATWQILTNINPDKHRNNRQFVLWNRRHIQVNGSTGGQSKLICRFDLADTKLSSKERKHTYNSNLYKNKGLLRNSLAVKFKPGPLCKKKFLDDSHQKYNSEIELVNLPRIGLDVQPRLGTTIEPTIMTFLNNLRNEDGSVSQKWAEFAVSVIGRKENNNVKLRSMDCVTFDLNYKYNHRKILMRKYLDGTCNIKDANIQTENINVKDQRNTLSEIKSMMKEMIDAVEISINQDNMFTQESDLLEIISEDSRTNTDISTSLKEKTKKRYCELNRLAVTVIRLPDSLEKETSQSCPNLHCNLGCVCDSIRRTFNLRQHCGREMCMFDCKCEFLNYTSLDVSNNGWLPTIKGIEDNINMNLAKEEQKFHQTVILTGEKNILFKSEKRNWKSSKKYDNFYKNMCLKNVNYRKRILSVKAIKFNCENIEPWCMVHNLYKCFCKGRFLTSNSSSILIPNLSDEMRLTDTISSIDNSSKATTMSAKKILRSRTRIVEPVGDMPTKDTFHTDNSPSTCGKIEKICQLDRRSNKKETTVIDHSRKSDIISKPSDERPSVNRKKSTSESSDPYEFYYSDYNGTCSRVTVYEGRKYSDEHYKYTNNKIRDLEKNDKTLAMKMMTILNADPETANNLNVTEDITTAINVNSIVMDLDNNQEKEIECNPAEDQEKEKSSNTADSSNDPNFIKFFYDIDGLSSSDCSNSTRKLLPNESRLITWVESNYKLYKQCVDKGHVKTSLEPPKAGKVALYSWDFILGRYRDRKNLFLVSKQKPYRIFMGVNTKISMLQSCININEIRFADLHQYPQTVKNLLTNATGLEDNFCILRGYSHCWELVGSVTKLNKNDDSTMEINDEASEIEPNLQYNQSEVDIEPSDFDTLIKENMPTPLLETPPEQSESILNTSYNDGTSKWFVMVVENDFQEVRFYKKGFFVKYESILKAIDVARLSGKTVRLSSQKCVDRNSGPQFGVYAIPKVNECCVFIGPYDLRDSLGIETVKTLLDVRKKRRTRGFWIVTKTIDNVHVIDNPMSFMSLQKFQNNEGIPLENYCNDLNEPVSPEKPNAELDKTITKSSLFGNSVKNIRPIKIRKSKDVFQLTNNGSLTKVSIANPKKFITYVPILNKKVLNGSEVVTKSSAINIVDSNNTLNVTPLKKDNSVVDEPQIKITAVYSQKDESISKCENKGMCILKPEEINRKLMKGELNTETATVEAIIHNVDHEFSNSEDMNIVLENVPGELTACTIDSDVCVISDDDSELS